MKLVDNNCLKYVRQWQVLAEELSLLPRITAGIQEIHKTTGSFCLVCLSLFSYKALSLLESILADIEMIEAALWPLEAAQRRHAMDAFMSQCEKDTQRVQAELRFAS